MHLRALMSIVYASNQFVKLRIIIKIYFHRGLILNIEKQSTYKVCIGQTLWCFVTVNVLGLFFTIPWDSLLCMIVVFLDYTH